MYSMPGRWAGTDEADFQEKGWTSQRKDEDSGYVKEVMDSRIFHVLSAVAFKIGCGCWKKEQVYEVVNSEGVRLGSLVSSPRQHYARFHGPMKNATSHTHFS